MEFIKPFISQKNLSFEIPYVFCLRVFVVAR